MGRGGDRRPACGLFLRRGLIPGNPAHGAAPAHAAPMSQRKQNYDVHGMPLTVEAESASLLRPVDAILGPFVTARPTRAAFALRLCYGKAPTDGTPGGLRLFWEGTLPGGTELAYYTGPSARRVTQPGLTDLHMDLRLRKACATVARGAEQSIGYGCLVPVLSEFLPQTGQHVVHGASLWVREGRKRLAVLLSGPAGSGKTTAALALAGAGMSLMTDDASVVTTRRRRRNGPVVVWGLPRPCKVHRQTVALLPWLSKLPRRPLKAEGECLVHLADVAQVDPRREVEVGLVLWLGKRSRAGHRVQRLDPVAAISLLARESLRAVDTSRDGPAGRAFGVLAALVRQCPVYSLGAGARPETLHETVLPLLRT